MNGYLYLPVMNQHPGAELPPSPHADARTSWEQHFLPLVQEQLRIIRSIDLSLPADVLAATIPVAAERAAYGFASTMAVVGQVSEKLLPLVGFLEKAFPPDGALRAMTLVGGYANETAQLGGAIQKLADIAREAPAVVQALQAAGPQSMEGVPACGPFLTALAAFIEDYGDSALTWFETHGVTWREDPAPVYQLVAAALKDSRAPAGASAAERREKMLDECLGQLSGSEQALLQTLAADAADYVPIIEGRARWQVALAGSMRRPILALGNRLVENGVLQAPGDIFYLHMTELADAADGTVLPRDVIAQRMADMERWKDLVPPLSLGLPVVREQLRRNPMMRYLWGVPDDAVEGAREVRGAGASRGIATGRAVVVLDLADAERLEQGDILVCPFTAPPWTPLFAIAGAIVTNTGGVLSHAAIEAREYAVPCVVGTGNGTRIIPDGAQVTVDGSSGVVTIHG